MVPAATAAVMTAAVVATAVMMMVISGVIGAPMRAVRGTAIRAPNGAHDGNHCQDEANDQTGKHQVPVHLPACSKGDRAEYQNAPIDRDPNDGTVQIG